MGAGVRPRLRQGPSRALGARGGEYAAILKANEAVGKTKRVSAHGIADGKNELTFYSIAEAESLEAAVEAFASNPHLTIPQSSIEIMELRSFTGP